MVLTVLMISEVVAWKPAMGPQVTSRLFRRGLAVAVEPISARLRMKDLGAIIMKVGLFKGGSERR